MKRVAIVGATGLVGGVILEILQERCFPIEELYLLASARSAEEVLEFGGRTYIVQDVAQFDFSQTQICFFCATNAISARYAPMAADAGNIVIDKSSHFRYHADVPLIVPEVNGVVLREEYSGGIIANPNCSTIPIAMVLKPIHDAVGVERINVATYQSVSGAGKEAMQELAQQTAQLLNGLPVESKVFSQQIAFNVIPHIDKFEDNGYTREEMKVVWELQKILQMPELAVNVTAVRVPVFYGHSAAVHIETNDKITAVQASVLLSDFPGIRVMENHDPCPTPARDAAGNDWVTVGRLREDISFDHGLDLWVISDNLRKGAALNAVQITEFLLS